MDNHTVTYDEYHKAMNLIKETEPAYKWRMGSPILDHLRKIGQDDIISAEVRLALMNDILERVAGE